jgi:hypothetical protein
MPTFIGKPRSFEALAQSIYPDLQSSAKAPRPKYEPSTGDWWDNKPAQPQPPKQPTKLEPWMEASLRHHGLVRNRR